MLFLSGEEPSAILAPEKFIRHKRIRMHGINIDMDMDMDMDMDNNPVFLFMTHLTIFLNERLMGEGKKKALSLA